MPATRVRHTLSSSTSRTCHVEGEELAIAFAPYATSLDVWESNRRLSHERRRPHAPSSSPPSHASAPRRMPLPCAPSESPLRTHACSCGPPRPRTFGVCRAPRGVRPHTQNGRSFTGTFLPFRTNDVARSAVGNAIPSISPLCGGRECFVRVRGVFEFISTVSRKTDS